MFVEFAVMFIAGVLIGCALMSVVFRPKVGGIINIDRSDPVDGPYLFLELTESVNELSAREYVKFKVQNKNYISPE